jgi:hypothetical protein
MFLNKTLLVWRWATGWKTRVRFIAGSTYFSLLHSFQIGSEAHPVGITGNFLGDKVART